VATEFVSSVHHLLVNNALIASELVDTFSNPVHVNKSKTLARRPDMLDRLQANMLGLRVKVKRWQRSDLPVLAADILC
jgi:hypothetical protein